MCSGSPDSAASAVSSCTFTLVMHAAAHCGGSLPITVGCKPAASANVGTSTQHPLGRLVMYPSFRTFPMNLKGLFVATASMIHEQYSTLRQSIALDSNWSGSTLAYFSAMVLPHL